MTADICTYRLPGGATCGEPVALTVAIPWIGAHPGTVNGKMCRTHAYEQIRPATTTTPPTIAGLEIDLHRAKKALLTLFNDDGEYLRAVVPSGTTVIVGDAWLTLPRGANKWVWSPDLTYRVASEADVLAWQPLGGAADEDLVS